MTENDLILRQRSPISTCISRKAFSSSLTGKIKLFKSLKQVDTHTHSHHVCLWLERFIKNSLYMQLCIVFFPLNVHITYLFIYFSPSAADWFPLTQNKTLNPNIKYFTTQLTSEVSRLCFRGMTDPEK